MSSTLLSVPTTVTRPCAVRGGACGRDRRVGELSVVRGQARCAGERTRRSTAALTALAEHREGLGAALLGVGRLDDRGLGDLVFGCGGLGHC